ncbi:hypothetical protein [Nocardia fusca]|uniref:hypothetical protein n=1 Tax=Nocardia fusca TaxID=941183 RepID=UPI003F774016
MRISANVLNLPLRPPSVLARAAASLNLLSDGRVETDRLPQEAAYRRALGTTRWGPPHSH